MKTHGNGFVPSVPVPRFELLNRQRVRTVDRRWLCDRVQAALTCCLSESGRRGGVLAEIEEVSVVLVSDAKIAAMHRDFMDIPGPTDVITFQHGEVVVSVETALREARERGLGFHEELLRYIVHGFLHLSGLDDIRPGLRREMHRIQERFCGELLRQQKSIPHD